MSLISEISGNADFPIDQEMCLYPYIFFFRINNFLANKQKKGILFFLFVLKG